MVKICNAVFVTSRCQSELNYFCYNLGLVYPKKYFKLVWRGAFERFTESISVGVALSCNAT